EVFKRKTAPTDISSYLPTTVDLAFGAKKEIFEYSDRVGEASIVGGSPDNIPFVDVFVTEEEHPIISTMVGYRYSFQELDALNFAASRGQSFSGDIGTMRMEAAIEALQLKEHLIGCYGSPSHGVYGLFNNPNVPEYDETGFNPYTVDPDTGAGDLHDWYVQTIHATIKENTLLTEKPTIIIQPDRLTTKLATTFRAAASDTTALEMIQKTLSSLGIVQIVSRNEVRSDWLEKYGVDVGGTNKDMLFIYDLNSRIVNRKISPVRTLPFEYSNGMYKRLMYQTLSSTKFHYPNGALYVRFPKYTP
ncbi:MAG TPA: major capsid family protein, partial [Methanosarcina sp.]|nr:major capsid family protein [Methanosarcina sp.]